MKIKINRSQYEEMMWMGFLSLTCSLLGCMFMIGYIWLLLDEWYILNYILAISAMIIFVVSLIFCIDFFKNRNKIIEEIIEVNSCEILK